MEGRISLPEHVRDSKLLTIQRDGLTIHSKPSCRRTSQTRESWGVEKMLGHGGNGVVWLQRRADETFTGPQFRAVKQIRVAQDSKSSPKLYMRELEALAKFSQPRYTDFFVELYGWYIDSSYLHIALEYCEHGDLMVYLKNKGILPENEVQYISAQVLGGISIMHQAGFAHRDIKPANILIKSRPPQDWWVKVSDLGLSKRTETLAGSTTVRGTPGYMPPETLGLDGGQTGLNPHLADMWCLGETIFQMLTGRGTFSHIMELVNYHRGDIEFPIEEMEVAGSSPEAIGFVKSLMAALPNKRLTAVEAQAHDWMRPSFEEFKSISELFLPAETGLHDHEVQGKLSRHHVTDYHTQASAAWSTMTAQHIPDSFYTKAMDYATLPHIAQTSTTASGPSIQFLSEEASQMASTSTSQTSLGPNGTSMPDRTTDTPSESNMNAVDRSLEHLRHNNLDDSGSQETAPPPKILLHLQGPDGMLGLNIDETATFRQLRILLLEQLPETVDLKSIMVTQAKGGSKRLIDILGLKINQMGYKHNDIIHFDYKHDKNLHQDEVYSSRPRSLVASGTAKVMRNIRTATKGPNTAQISIIQATDNSPSGPTQAQMMEIAKRTHGVGCVYILDVIESRLKSKGKNWPQVLNALHVLEICLLEGSRHVVSWTKQHADLIYPLQKFQYVDENIVGGGEEIRLAARKLASWIEDEKLLRDARKSRQIS